MKRHTIWLLAALLLFGVAAWLMSVGETGALSEGKQKKREFPQLSAESWGRQEKRLTMPALASSSTRENEPVPARKRDPVLAALAPKAEVNLVFEASAIRDSPVGELLLRCMNRSPGAGEQDTLKEMGLDIVHDLDRLAMSDNVLIASGNFGKVRWDEVFAGKPVTRQNGTAYYKIYDMPSAPQEIAVHQSGLVMWGVRASIEAAVDRLEGRGPDEPPPIAPHETYGEIYGIISAGKLSELLPAEIGPKLADAANKVELHADTRDDVLIVADVDGPEPRRVEELGRALAGALAVGRVKARVDKDKELEQLMELSRVSLRGRSFRIESAFPLALIARSLGSCAAADAGAKVGP